MKKQILLDKLLDLQSAHTRLLIEDEQREMYFNKIDAQNRELLGDNDKLREECAHWQRKHLEVSEQLNQSNTKVEELDYKQWIILPEINRILYNWQAVDTRLFKLDDNRKITNLEYWAPDDNGWQRSNFYDNFGDFLYRNKPEETQNDKDKEEKEA